MEPRVTESESVVLPLNYSPKAPLGRVLADLRKGMRRVAARCGRAFSIFATLINARAPLYARMVNAKRTGGFGPARRCRTDAGCCWSYLVPRATIRAPRQCVREPIA